MSRKVCKNCNSENIKIEAVSGTYRIVCGECKRATEYYDSIAEAWDDWCAHHQKRLSFTCPECGERILTRWHFCPICGLIVTEEDRK